MKIRILVLAAIAVLALTAVAVAKTNTLTGKLTGFGQAKAKITIKIKTNKKGVATKATAVNVTNFKAECVDANSNSTPGKTVSAKLGSFKVRKQPVESGGFSWQILVRSKMVDGNSWHLAIILGSKKGRSASGGISYNYPHPDYPSDRVHAGCGANGRISAKVK